MAYLDHLPDGINAEISLQCLDKGKRWLQLLLQPQEWRQDGTTETTQWNDQALTDLLLLLGIDKVFLNSRISFRARLSVQLSHFQLHLGRHELELSKDKELPAHGCRARSLQSSSTFARPCQVYNALEDQGKKYFKIILRAQGILEEKTTEFDWTGLSPGPEIHFLDIVLK